MASIFLPGLAGPSQQGLRHQQLSGVSIRRDQGGPDLRHKRPGEQGLTSDTVWLRQSFYPQDTTEVSFTELGGGERKGK